ncbi:MAG: acetyl-CoA carboxylase biotin carboxyl carrier protein [Myxococcales bacterium]|nr:acetyl-CoA carboxylase biotin carboxyl carrier protein [Myxococcales bacterium]
MELDLDQLKKIMQALRDHDVDELEYENEQERIAIRRNTGRGVVMTQAAAPAAPAPTAQSSSSSVVPADDPNVVIVTSPFVGTFYRAPSPDTDPFVEVGTEVSKGQPLCIVEAMKLMNEIECDLDGTIVEILMENGKPVEYGDSLFKIRKR